LPTKRTEFTMAGGALVVEGTSDLSRIEAPVTFKAYLICAFAAFGGICTFVSKFGP
jgi:hypothetical protein